MNLALKTIPDLPGIGIYGAEKRLPQRARFLAPAAADSFLTQLVPFGIRCSDMYRSAEASLVAKKTRAGAQRPGYSGHNYGFSIDLDVDFLLKREKWKKADLNLFMAEQGWICHRLDNQRGFEDWHYNHLVHGDVIGFFPKEGETKSSRGLERKIVETYGTWWGMQNARTSQELLQKAGLYQGAIDGKIGPQSRAAIGAFQRAWLIPVTETLDEMTRRTLAFVTATRVVAP